MRQNDSHPDNDYGDDRPPIEAVYEQASEQDRQRGLGLAFAALRRGEQ